MGSAWKPTSGPGPTRPCLAWASGSEGTLVADSPGSVQAPSGQVAGPLEASG